MKSFKEEIRKKKAITANSYFCGLTQRNVCKFWNKEFGKMQKLVFSDNFIVSMILWSCVKYGRNIEWRTWIRCSVKAGDKNFGWHMDCVQNYVYIWLNRNKVNIESIKVEDQTCRHFTIKILWWIRGSKDNLEYVASNIKEKRNIRYWDIMVLKKIKLFKKERYPMLFSG